MSAAFTPRADATPRPASRPRLLDRLFEPVPIAPLVQFRIALGLILLWEAYRYISEGWPRELFLRPGLLFKYYGFEWVRPLPEPLHVALFPVLGLCAICVAAGLYYRIAAALLFVGWAYVFLLDQANYLNHMYLVTVIAGLSVLLPANRAYSLDALHNPAFRSDVVPRWTVGLLRAQIGLVYFFGGIAKLNGDWLSGVPMQLMLLQRSDLLGPAAGEPWAALFFAYGGLLLDLFIVPLLWWRKTRVLALLLVAGFHLTNHVIFRIGIFPWLMMAATLILWPPLPLNLVRFLRIYGVLVLLGLIALLAFPSERRDVPVWAWSIVPALVAVWTIEFWLPDWRRYDLDPSPDLHEHPVNVVPAKARPVVITLLGVFFAWQIAMPFRHLLYPGDVAWHEQGHKWSWHMKLRIKRPFDAEFFVVDADGHTVGDYRLAPTEAGEPQFFPILDPVGVGFPLAPKQVWAMTTRPELILQFAHFLRDRYEGRVKGPVQVRAKILVSLDGRKPADLINPEADLAKIDDRLWPPADWVLPLDLDRPKLERQQVQARPAGVQPSEEREESGTEL